jgi:signal transduction histidine kinase
VRLRDVLSWAFGALAALGALAWVAHATTHPALLAGASERLHWYLAGLAVGGALLTGLAAARAGEAARRRALAEAEAGRAVALAGLVHELRNPLSGLSLLAGAVVEDVAGTAAAAHAARLKAEVDALARLVEEGLAEARALPPVRAAVALGPLAEEVAALVRPLAGDHGVEVRVAAEGEARADRDQLRRALLNLARNAVEASPDNGVVELRAGRRGEAAVLAVLDRGPGLDEAVRARLFQPFATTKPHGTGLGLALARRVAEAHGGTLALLPRAGGGTEARLTVPDGHG